jgi:hypothetical protein
MNTNDLIKTAQYLDKLGSFKIADKVENKLVRLAAETLLVDPAIEAEIKFLENQIKKLTLTEPYYTTQFYGHVTYIKREMVRIGPGELEKRLAKIKSTEFIKDFNLKRANYLRTVKVPEYAKNGKIEEQNRALGTAMILEKNAKNGISKYESQSKPGKPSAQTGSGKPSKGTGKPSGQSGSGKPSGKPSGQATVTVRPTSNTIGSPGSSGGAAVSAGPPTAPNSTTNSAPPASPEEGKSSLISLLDELDSITANENVWKANVNTVIPKLRKANTLFTQIYDSLSIKEARLLGNRLDMITLANTTFTGRFSGMR